MKEPILYLKTFHSFKWQFYSVKPVSFHGFGSSEEIRRSIQKKTRHVFQSFYVFNWTWQHSKSFSKEFYFNACDVNYFVTPTTPGLYRYHTPLWLASLLWAANTIFVSFTVTVLFFYFLFGRNTCCCSFCVV